MTPRIALTARHAIVDHLADESIVIQIVYADGRSVAATIFNEVIIPESEDLVFLHLSEEVGEVELELSASHMPSGLDWLAFGFPNSRSTNGALIHGRVSNWLPESVTPRDVELSVEDFRAIANYRGFSGAPVVVNGRVAAILLRQLDGVLAAISILRVRKYLELAFIPYHSLETMERVPPGLKGAAEVAVPNVRTFWALENALESASSKYVILSGAPGSGKTLVGAMFQPADARKTVVGTYFAAGDGELIRLPVDHYRGAGAFSVWLAQATALLTSEGRAASARDGKEIHLRSIANNLVALAAYYGRKGKRGILILDDVYANTSNPADSLLRALPPSPPSNLLVVLSTSNAAGLQASAPELRYAAVVAMLPLDQVDCERVVHRALPQLGTASEGSRLASASEGNPLVLSYLIRQTRSTIAKAQEEAVAEEYISFGGEINNYYEQQWSRIAQNDGATWLLATLSRTRGRFPKDELPKLVPESQLGGLLNSLSSVMHLLAEEEGGIGVFHLSFCDYVLSKTAILSGALHDRLAGYCAASESVYAIANIVHHRLGGTTPARALAAQACNQEWIDASALCCVPPVYVLDDVDQVLTKVMSEGDFVSAIRVLLLRSRTRFRYNAVLGSTGYAVELATVALPLRGPRASLAFVLRGQQMHCSAPDAVHLIRRLLMNDSAEHAILLFKELRNRCVAAYETNDGFPLEMLAAHLEALGILLFELGPPWLDELKRLMRMLDDIADQFGPNGALADASISGLPSSASLWRVGWFVYSVRRRDSNPALYATQLVLILDHAHRVLCLHPRPDLKCDPPPVSDVFRIWNVRSAAAEIEDRAKINGVLPGAERIAAEVLARAGRSPELVATIGNQHIQRPIEISIRASNGVDPNHGALEEWMFASMVAAYSNDETMPKRISFASRHAWEQRFLDAYGWIGRASGRWQRRRREAGSGDSGSLASLASELLSEFIPLLSFSLGDRAKWEESYNLPESLAPVLWMRVGDLISAFEVEAAKPVALAALSRLEEQLGLYTEGCRRALDGLADSLVFVAPGVSRDIRLALFHHIDACTRNRLERVPALLSCAIGAADCGDLVLAEKVFGATLASSLGPDWYKEGQFALLLDALRGANDPVLTKKHWRDVAELLERASGELTFQRYVRHEKEELVRHLAKSGLLAEAVQLLRHYLWPDNSTQIGRIVGASADHTSRLSGGRFGVMEVDEQAGILALIEGLDGASALHKCALVETFLHGDVRHFAAFAKVCCSLLAGPQSEHVGRRILRLLKLDFAPEKRPIFLSHLRDADPRLAAPILEEAEALGMRPLEPDSPSPQTQTAPTRIVRVADVPAAARATEARPKAVRNEDDFLLPGTFGRASGMRELDSAISLALQRMGAGDRDEARKLFLGGLKSAQDAMWNVWENNRNCTQAIDGILFRTGSFETGVSAIAGIVNAEIYAQDWVVANTLVARAMPERHEIASAVLSEVLDHIRSILVPELERDVTYETKGLDSNLQLATANEAIESVLVLCLDHPSQHQRDRAAATIYWLGSVSTFGVRGLLNRIANKENIGHGREIAVGILHAWAVHANEHLRRELTGNALFLSLAEDPSAAVRYGIRQVAKIQGIQLAEQSQSRVSQGDLQRAQEWNWEDDAHNILELQNGSIASAGTYLVDLCKPNSPEDLMELLRVKGQAYDARYEAWSSGVEREACLRAIGELPEEQLRALAEEMVWNPRWPENELAVDGKSVAAMILGRIKAQELEECFVVGGDIILHCREHEIDPKSHGVTETEIIAVLAPSSFFEGGLSEESLSLWTSTHGYEDKQTPRLVLSPTEAAVVRFRDRFPRIGGGMTPALPSPRLLELTGHGTNDFRRSVWRDGRVWEPRSVGPALKGGTTLWMKPSPRLRLSGEDLVWAVLKNRRLQYIVEPSARRIHTTEGK